MKASCGTLTEYLTLPQNRWENHKVIAAQKKPGVPKEYVLILICCKALMFLILLYEMNSVFSINFIDGFLLTKVLLVHL